MSEHFHHMIDRCMTRLIQGPVSFRNGQRRAETVISQFQMNASQQQFTIIAEYSRMTGFDTNCSRCRSLLWPRKHRHYIVHIDKKNYCRSRYDARRYRTKRNPTVGDEYNGNCIDYWRLFTRPRSCYFLSHVQYYSSTSAVIDFLLDIHYRL
jgi:RNase P subunit RPR2